ncbi:MAG TPA: glycosyltransferase family 4 protein [bacterium]|nr:glycosyltransferase family 4 protein [bacterium]
MKPRLRILMPSIYFPPRVGGIESHVYYLARELVRRGHHVEIVTTRTEKASARAEVTDGITIDRIHSFGKHPAGWILSSLLAIPKVVGLAKRSDVIHCHTFAFALSGSVANLLAGRPLVVTVHESHFLRFAKRWYMRPFLRLPLVRAGVLLSTSKEIDGVTRELLPGARTLPIVNGIDTEKFKPVPPALKKAPGEMLIVCPRRLVEKNGVEFLVRAVPLLRDRVRVKVHIAGDGPLRSHIQALARDLGVADQIVFMGSVENALMPAIFSSADLVVIPSLIEATSIAALEAMACERVIAASRVGGLPEIIDESVGILFESGSPEAIADAIAGFAKRSDAAEMGRAARRRVETNWSISKMTDIHEQIYLELAGPARAKRGADA